MNDKVNFPENTCDCPLAKIANWHETGCELMEKRMQQGNVKELVEAVAKYAVSEHAQRKATPMATGLLDYFPDALAEVSRVSKAGNDQHNPGEPLHWAKEKSTDHADCIIRHMVDRGTKDTDGERHSAKVAWRALAMLQIELEAEKNQ